MALTWIHTFSPLTKNICWLGSWDDSFQIKECRNFKFDRNCPTAIQRGLISVHPISNARVKRPLLSEISVSWTRACNTTTVDLTIPDGYSGTKGWDMLDKGMIHSQAEWSRMVQDFIVGLFTCSSTRPVQTCVVQESTVLRPVICYLHL